MLGSLFRLMRIRYSSQCLLRILKFNNFQAEHGDALISFCLLASLAIVVAVSTINSGIFSKSLNDLTISAALSNAIMERPLVMETSSEGLIQLSSDIATRRSELTRLSRLIYLSLLDAANGDTSFESCSDVYSADPSSACTPQRLNDGRDEQGNLCAVNHALCSTHVSSQVTELGCTQSRFFVCAQIRELKNSIPVADRATLVTPSSDQLAILATPTASCSNGLLDGFETAIDCGGPSCAACPIPPTSNDRRDRNANETDVVLSDSNDRSNSESELVF